MSALITWNIDVFLLQPKCHVTSKSELNSGVRLFVTV